MTSRVRERKTERDRHASFCMFSSNLLELILTISSSPPRWESLTQETQELSLALLHFEQLTCSSSQHTPHTTHNAIHRPYTGYILPTPHHSHSANSRRSRLNAHYSHARSPHDQHHMQLAQEPVLTCDSSLHAGT
ncbi:hypothetical protein ABZP36_022261 [Zizania latifolia]